jgi:hypothetical protein
MNEVHVAVVDVTRPDETPNLPQRQRQCRGNAIAYPAKAQSVSVEFPENVLPAGEVNQL